MKQYIVNEDVLIKAGIDVSNLIVAMSYWCDDFMLTEAKALDIEIEDKEDFLEFMSDYCMEVDYSDCNDQITQGIRVYDAEIKKSKGDVKC